ncbi:hypothetical protein [Amycolatopsis sp. H20-H5]|uniref:hypothetical protein n=1 Tax=Amycolatopsis sp. H20-H5 TaxID=3046309 RepID=UPI002DBA0365|nr:hypothetical protein [Amycolatopsis sp. H20-H5]MEC3976372.1 hypothetical protein [Amycolatopsis sp. H20-H5]
MLGSEQNPQRLSLPPTVVAGHLRSCADELTGSLQVTGAPATAGELAEVVTQLVAGQHALAEALKGLSARIGLARRTGALAAAPEADVAAVAEILQMAAEAVGCSADALGEVEPSFECVSESVGPGTRL